MKNWKPKEGERYWMILHLQITSFEWDSQAAQHQRDYEMGNCFATEALAQSALTKIKQALKETDRE